MTDNISLFYCCLLLMRKWHRFVSCIDGRGLGSCLNGAISCFGGLILVLMVLFDVLVALLRFNVLVAPSDVLPALMSYWP